MFAKHTRISRLHIPPCKVNILAILFKEIRMWIDKYLELDGMRLECIIKSKSLLDHSKMQRLSPEDIQDIKNQADNLIKYVMMKIESSERRIRNAGQSSNTI